MRSDRIKKGPDRAPHRSLLRATGVIERESDFEKPFIAVVNSYVDIVPGHAHLREFVQSIKRYIREAGGVPFEFNTIGVDDGIAMGHEGMHWSLPSRELIADSVETMLRAHAFDAAIFIPNCDKIVPGMLMAALRVNIPSIFVSGGPMRAGVLPSSGRVVDLISVFEALGQLKKGEISEEELKEIETYACPGCGSCSGLFTANSMNSLLEALGLAPPGNGTILAEDPRREELKKKAAYRVVELAFEDLKPRDIVSLASFTPSGSTWPWAARRTPCSTPWPPPRRRGSPSRSSASTRSAAPPQRSPRSPRAPPTTWRTWTAPAASTRS